MGRSAPFLLMNDFWTAIAAIFAALTLVAGAYEVGFQRGASKTSENLNSEREFKRFSEIYAPLYGLFTMLHITTVSATGAPYFRQRAKRALSILREERRIGDAFRALFDRQELGTTGEVEYGGDFPIAGITRHVTGKEQFADRALLDLVSRANRAQYEDRPRAGELTSADLDLFNHICAQYDLLEKRFGWV